ncbi:MAG TPA: hypothetical protein VGG36_05160, partial [Rhizomicrobium sp.]
MAKLSEQLSRLASDFVQTAGHSAIELSALAGRTGSLEAQLNDVRVESEERNRGVEARLSEIARLAEFAARLDRVSEDAARTSQAVSRELARFSETSTAGQRALAEQVTELRSGLSSTANESAGRHDMLERRLETLFTQTADLLAARLAEVSADLGTVHNEASDTTRALKDQLGRAAEQAASGDAALSARVEALAAEHGNTSQADRLKFSHLSDRLMTLEGAVAERVADLETRLEESHLAGTIAEIGSRVVSLGDDVANAKQHHASQLSDHAAKAAEDRRAVSLRLDRLHQGLDNAQNEAFERHEALETQFGALIAQTADSLSNRVETLSANLGDVRRDSSAATQTLGEQLKQAIDRATARDAALTAKLGQLEAALETVRSEKSNATQALEQRVTQLARLFGDAQVVAAGENEKLHARLGEFQDQTVESLRSLQQQHAETQNDLAARDAMLDGHRRQAREELEALAGKLAEVRDDLTARDATWNDHRGQAREELGALADKLSAVQTDVGSLAERHAAHTGDTHTALDQLQARLDENTARAGDTHAAVERLQARLEENQSGARQSSRAFDERLSKLSDGVTALEGRLESETKRAREEVARDSRHTHEKIAALEQSHAHAGEQAAVQSEVLKKELQTLAQELNRVESQIPDTTGLHTRLSGVEEGTSKRIVSLAANLQSLAGLLAATRS